MLKPKTLPVVALCLTSILLGCPRSKVSPTVDPGTAYQVSAVPGPPPWRVPTDPNARLGLAGLPALPVAEDPHQGAFHIHAGLRIYYQGQAVVIPAGIGLDRYGNAVSPLHTHQASGVIHVEYMVPREFKWGQFFALWGVPLGQSTVFVDGAPCGNLADLTFVDRQQVVVIFGTPPSAPIAWPSAPPEDAPDEAASPEPSPSPEASGSPGPDPATPSLTP